MPTSRFKQESLGKVSFIYNISQVQKCNVDGNFRNQYNPKNPLLHNNAFWRL